MGDTASLQGSPAAVRQTSAGACCARSPVPSGPQVHMPRHAASGQIFFRAFGQSKKKSLAPLAPFRPKIFLRCLWGGGVAEDRHCIMR